MGHPGLRGVEFVTRWLRSRYANVIELGKRHDQFRWRIVRDTPQREFIVRFTDVALFCAQSQIAEWLEWVADDAISRSLPPPAYYSVTSMGISVLGMDRLEFEFYGQAVKCWLDPGEQEWALAVDGLRMPGGVGRDHRDTREFLGYRVVDLLREKGVLRQADEPWSWSVLDEQGREWWARLVAGENADFPIDLLLLDCDTGIERRVPWTFDTRPNGAALRQLIKDLA